MSEREKEREKGGEREGEREKEEEREEIGVKGRDLELKDLKISPKILTLKKGQVPQVLPIIHNNNI